MPEPVISIEGLRKSYGEVDAVWGIDLQVDEKEIFAVLGPNGAGKTTMLEILEGYRSRDAGRVGVLVTDPAKPDSAWRERIGIVLQETTLFSGTIRDNIAFGWPDAPMEEIVAAAEAAEAHDFIMGFPEGYDTPVGERGVTLSGGQKQRVAIARALLLDPRILILDDATSSVDYETEYRIQRALERLMEGCTSFVIAQRIATVLNADQILVLDRGEIVARGTHEELLHESPIYAEIYYSQLEGEPIEALEVVA